MFIGGSQAILRVLELIDKAARSNSTFSTHQTPAIALHGVILRHPPPSGRELGSTRRILTPSHFFHKLRDTTSSAHQVAWDSTAVTPASRARHPQAVRAAHRRGRD